MYYINEEQLEARLAYMDGLADTCRLLVDRWQDEDPVLELAQERALHLAIECVTDIGSLLIDALILRDASSYEDIVEILQGEGAFSTEVAAALLELVKLRRPLVQDYIQFERSGLHPLTVRLPELLPETKRQIRDFLRKELQS